METRKTGSRIEKSFRMESRALIHATIILGALFSIIRTLLQAIPAGIRAKLLWRLLWLISVKPSKLTATKNLPAIIFGLRYQAFAFSLKEQNAILLLEPREKEERDRLFREFLKKLELEKMVEPPPSTQDALLELRTIERPLSQSSPLPRSCLLDNNCLSNARDGAHLVVVRTTGRHLGGGICRSEENTGRIAKSRTGQEHQRTLRNPPIYSYKNQKIGRLEE